jgi:hypothetical protein
MSRNALSVSILLAASACAERVGDEPTRIHPAVNGPGLDAEVATTDVADVESTDESTIPTASDAHAMTDQGIPDAGEPAIELPSCAELCESAPDRILECVGPVCPIIEVVDDPGDRQEQESKCLRHCARDPKSHAELANLVDGACDEWIAHVVEKLRGMPAVVDEDAYCSVACGNLFGCITDCGDNNQCSFDCMVSACVLDCEASEARCNASIYACFEEVCGYEVPQQPDDVQPARLLVQ